MQNKMMARTKCLLHQLLNDRLSCFGFINSFSSAPILLLFVASLGMSTIEIGGYLSSRLTRFGAEVAPSLSSSFRFPDLRTLYTVHKSLFPRSLNIACEYYNTDSHTKELHCICIHDKIPIHIIFLHWQPTGVANSYLICLWYLHSHSLQHPVGRGT